MEIGKYIPNVLETISSKKESEESRSSSDEAAEIEKSINIL